MRIIRPAKAFQQGKREIPVGVVRNVSFPGFCIRCGGKQEDVRDGVVFTRPILVEPVTDAVLVLSVPSWGWWR